MINKDEILYKIDTIIEYLKENGGENYQLYNRLCPNDDTEPDSNIVEYAEDVKEMIEILIKYSKEEIDNIYDELY